MAGNFPVHVFYCQLHLQRSAGKRGLFGEVGVPFVLFRLILGWYPYKGFTVLKAANGAFYYQDKIKGDFIVSKPKVFVTQEMPAPALQKLSGYCQVEVNDTGKPLTKAEMLVKVAGRDAVFCAISDTVDAEVLAAAGPQCRIFGNFGVGYNHIDVKKATELGIWVSNTPGVLTNATADLAWTLLLAAARRVAEGDRRMRQGVGFEGWGPLYLLGMEVSGKTLGIAGAGRIGAAMGRRGKGFDMNIIYTANQPKSELEAHTGARFVDKETLLKESDFLSLHMPLTENTRHYIGKKELEMMKSTAILINTARGPVVDEAALVEALRTGQIWGAGLDVYEKEPAIAHGLAELDNVVLLPHVGSATVETREKMAMMVAEDILAALDNRLPVHCLNPQARSLN